MCFPLNIESFFLLSLQSSNHSPLSIWSKSNSHTSNIVTWGFSMCQLMHIKHESHPLFDSSGLPPTHIFTGYNSIHLFDVCSVLVTKLAPRVNTLPKKITVHSGKIWNLVRSTEISINTTRKTEEIDINSTAIKGERSVCLQRDYDGWNFELTLEEWLRVFQERAGELGVWHGCTGRGRKMALLPWTSHKHIQ